MPLYKILIYKMKILNLIFVKNINDTEAFTHKIIIKTGSQKSL